MCDVPVLYATTEGQTRKIAEHMAAEFRARGVNSEAVDVNSPRAETLDWPHVQGVLVGASLHVGRHQPEVERFVRRHRDELHAHPSAFFSVSLSAASKNPAEVKAAADLAQQLPLTTGWHADNVVSVAGALMYSKYGFVKKQLIRWIAKREGGPTDTSRDHELTDWHVVDEVVDDMVRRIRN